MDMGCSNQAKLYYTDTGMNENVPIHDVLYTISLNCHGCSFMIDPTCSAEGALQELAEKEGWVSKGDQYFLHNQEEHVKPKKIIYRIEFDSDLMKCILANIPMITSCNTKITHAYT